MRGGESSLRPEDIDSSSLDEGYETGGGDTSSVGIEDPAEDAPDSFAEQKAGSVAEQDPVDEGATPLPAENTPPAAPVNEAPVASPAPAAPDPAAPAPEAQPQEAPAQPAQAPAAPTDPLGTERVEDDSRVARRNERREAKEAKEREKKIKRLDANIRKVAQLAESGRLESMNKFRKKGAGEQVMDAVKSTAQKVVTGAAIGGLLGGPFGAIAGMAGGVGSEIGKQVVRGVRGLADKIGERFGKENPQEELRQELEDIEHTRLTRLGDLALAAVQATQMEEGEKLEFEGTEYTADELRLKYLEFASKLADPKSEENKAIAEKTKKYNKGEFGWKALEFASSLVGAVLAGGGVVELVKAVKQKLTERAMEQGVNMHQGGIGVLSDQYGSATLQRMQELGHNVHTEGGRLVMDYHGGANGSELREIGQAFQNPNVPHWLTADKFFNSELIAKGMHEIINPSQEFLREFATKVSHAVQVMSAEIVGGTAVAASVIDLLRGPRNKNLVETESVGRDKKLKESLAASATPEAPDQARRPVSEGETGESGEAETIEVGSVYTPDQDYRLGEGENAPEIHPGNEVRVANVDESGAVEVEILQENGEPYTNDGELLTYPISHEEFIEHFHRVREPEQLEDTDDEEESVITEEEQRELDGLEPNEKALVEEALSKRGLRGKILSENGDQRADYEVGQYYDFLYKLEEQGIDVYEEGPEYDHCPFDGETDFRMSNVQFTKEGDRISIVFEYDLAPVADQEIEQGGYKQAGTFNETGEDPFSKEDFIAAANKAERDKPVVIRLSNGLKLYVEPGSARDQQFSVFDPENPDGEGGFFNYDDLTEKGWEGNFGVDWYAPKESETETTKEASTEKGVIPDSDSYGKFLIDKKAEQLGSSVKEFSDAVNNNDVDTNPVYVIDKEGALWQAVLVDKSKSDPNVELCPVTLDTEGKPSVAKENITKKLSEINGPFAFWIVKAEKTIPDLEKEKSEAVLAAAKELVGQGEVKAKRKDEDITTAPKRWWSSVDHLNDVCRDNDYYRHLDWSEVKAQPIGEDIIMSVDPDIPISKRTDGIPKINIKIHARLATEPAPVTPPTPPNEGEVAAGTEDGGKTPPTPPAETPPTPTGPTPPAEPEVPVITEKEAKLQEIRTLVNRLAAVGPMKARREEGDTNDSLIDEYAKVDKWMNLYDEAIGKANQYGFSLEEDIEGLKALATSTEYTLTIDPTPEISEADGKTVITIKGKAEAAKTPTSEEIEKEIDDLKEGDVVNPDSKNVAMVVDDFRETFDGGLNLRVDKITPEKTCYCDILLINADPNKQYAAPSSEKVRKKILNGKVKVTREDMAKVLAGDPVDLPIVSENEAYPEKLQEKIDNLKAGDILSEIDSPDVKIIFNDYQDTLEDGLTFEVSEINGDNVVCYITSLRGGKNPEPLDSYARNFPNGIVVKTTKSELLRAMKGEKVNFDLVDAGSNLPSQHFGLPEDEDGVGEEESPRVATVPSEHETPTGEPLPPAGGTEADVPDIISEPKKDGEPDAAEAEKRKKAEANTILQKLSGMGNVKIKFGEDPQDVSSENQRFNFLLGELRKLYPVVFSDGFHNPIDFSNGYKPNGEYTITVEADPRSDDIVDGKAMIVMTKVFEPRGEALPDEYRNSYDRIANPTLEKMNQFINGYTLGPQPKCRVMFQDDELNMWRVEGRIGNSYMIVQPNDPESVQTINGEEMMSRAEKNGFYVEGTEAASKRWNETKSEIEGVFQGTTKWKLNNILLGDGRVPQHLSDIETAEVGPISNISNDINAVIKIRGNGNESYDIKFGDLLRYFTITSPEGARNLPIRDWAVEKYGSEDLPEGQRPFDDERNREGLEAIDGGYRFSYPEGHLDIVIDREEQRQPYQISQDGVSFDARVAEINPAPSAEDTLTDEKQLVLSIPETGRNIPLTTSVAGMKEMFKQEENFRRQNG